MPPGVDTRVLTLHLDARALIEMSEERRLCAVNEHIVEGGVDFDGVDVFGPRQLRLHDFAAATGADDHHALGAEVSYQRPQVEAKLRCRLQTFAPVAAHSMQQHISRPVDIDPARLRPVDIDLDPAQRIPVLGDNGRFFVFFWHQR